ncbi:MAG: DUF2090 domain-containing protein [Candidatus Magasanikbacteria bacterium]|nr:DUF2090 domain-containing protein [Candidatus Magasanikbacteria bacterium]
MLEQFQKNGKYLMLALDHRGSFKKFVNKANPDSVTDEQLIQVKKMIINATRENFSGVLIDPDWGLKSFENPDKPYLLCIEKTGYSEDKGERTTQLEYSVQQLKEMGAGGIKILLYFNPEALSCSAQLETAKKVLNDCRVSNLPLFLEIVTYGNEALAKDRSEWVLRSVDAFIKANIIPDVFKLEYPGDEESCKKITAMLNGTPWILLTRGEPYEVFLEQLKIAYANGAVGFLAGRAIWQEVANYDNDADRLRFLDTIASERFREICDVVA